MAILTTEHFYYIIIEWNQSIRSSFSFLSRRIYSVQTTARIWPYVGWGWPISSSVSYFYLPILVLPVCPCYWLIFHNFLLFVFWRSLGAMPYEVPLWLTITDSILIASVLITKPEVFLSKMEEKIRRNLFQN